MEQIRGAPAQAGAEHKTLVIAGDGSFCNRTVLAAIPQRTVAIVRARKDAKLCFVAVDEGRRVDAALKFTPESVRQDDRMPSYSPWLPPPTANVSPAAALVVAAYSALMLTALRAFGPRCGAAYAALPRWRRKAKRPSCLDLTTLLRKRLSSTLICSCPLGIYTSPAAT